MSVYEPLLIQNGHAVDLAGLVIESERLHMRIVTVDDAQAIYHHFTSEITRYMFHKPPASLAEVEQFVQEARACASAAINLQLAVMTRADNDFLGVCGLHKLKTDEAPETGIWIKKAAQGLQYGLEAVTAVKNWAASTLDYSCLLYPVDRDNLASRALAEKLGGLQAGGYSRENSAGTRLNIITYHIPFA